MSSIEKLFIPYQEAFEMKLIGYNEFNIAYYHNHIEYSFVKDLHRNNYTRNSEQNLYFTDCSAPTYSQCFSWFREKYNLDSFCRQINTKEKSYWKITKLETNDKIKGYSGFTDTYYDAELECLKQLIKICR